MHSGPGGDISDKKTGIHLICPSPSALVSSQLTVWTRTPTLRTLHLTTRTLRRTTNQKTGPTTRRTSEMTAYTSPRLLKAHCFCLWLLLVFVLIISYKKLKMIFIIFIINTLLYFKLGSREITSARTYV